MAFLDDQTRSETAISSLLLPQSAAATLDHGMLLFFAVLMYTQYCPMLAVQEKERSYISGMRGRERRVVDGRR